MHTVSLRAARVTLAATLLAGLAFSARADVITDWNGRAGHFIVEAKLGTPPAIRVMAIVQTAAHEALRDLAQASRTAPAPAAVDAAVAAANRITLAKLLPAQQAAIESAYQAALAAIADGPAKAAGIAAGENAAAAVLARRADDGTTAAESYRPHTTAGAYVPTALPAASQWSQRKPWLLAASSQLRPTAPPSLASETWARDYNEVRAIGGRTSSQRSAEQTEIARFWEYSLPPIYMGVVRSVAQMPGRQPAHNAALYAAVAQAMDDAMISVFEAKYHYGFWRPVTAIRNGDIDGHPATEREANWASLIEAPMHPEYPSGHGILAAAVGAVLKADVGGRPVELATTSPSAKGATRRWTSVDDFVREVSDSRIYAGIHYRTTMDVSVAMGTKIGELAAAKFLQPQ